MEKSTLMPSSLEINLDESILLSIAVAIAVIDVEGTIIAVNKAWTDFAKENDAKEIGTLGKGANYLSVYRKSADTGDQYAEKSIKGIRSVLDGKLKTFYLEYPIHLPNNKRWFALRVNLLSGHKSKAVILHEDITDKKMVVAESQEILKTLEQKNKELEASKRQFDDAQTITKLGSFELDLKTFTNKWSDGHYRIFGLEPQSENITYERFLGFVVPEDISKVNDPIQSLAKLGKVHWDVEYRIHVPNQGIKHILGKAETRLGPKGDVKSIYGIVQDISDSVKKESELSLKNEALYNSVTPIAYSNLEGVITYANPAFIKLWGFEKESEVLGLSNKELGSSEETISQIMQGVQAYGQWSGRDQAKKKDGTLFDIFFSVNLVKDDEGLPICMVGSFIDLTKQEKVKKDLAVSEAKAKTLFDYSPIIIWEEDFSQVKSFFNSLKKKGITDYRDYFENAPEEVQRLSELIVITQVNQTSLDFYGAKSLIELKTNLPDWFVEDSWEVYKEELIALAEGHSEFKSEIPVRTPKGKIKHLFLKLSVPPQYMDTLEVVLVSFVDVTERNQREAQLKEKEQEVLEHANQLEHKVADRTRELALSEAKLVEANKLAKIGHWTHDLSKGEGISSEGVYDIYGLEKNQPLTAELLMEKIQIEEDDSVQINQRVAAIMRGEIVDDLEYRIINAKGEEKYVRSILKPPMVDDSGKNRILFGVLQDITKEKKAELQLASALQKEKDLGELKSRFVSMASHEFRTPLSAILSSVELIKRYGEKGLVGKQETHIERIRSSVHNLTNILNDFLSLEKLESGKANFIPQQVLFDSYIQNILQEVMPWAQENQNVICEHSGPKEVCIDPHLIQNVLLNLLSNALKYSQEGTDVSLISENMGDRLQIKIIDQGIGIPEDEQKNMFTRFFRASNATNLKGTGLGLTILKRYLDLMKGTISFESKLGEGSTFTVVIPQ